MNTIHTSLCGAIPSHILASLAEHASGAAGRDARGTLAQMRSMAGGRREGPALLGVMTGQQLPGRNRYVYDARRQFVLPGKLVITERVHTASADVQAREAFAGLGATHDFLGEVYGRKSIDDRGMALLATVHYGTHFQNAMWDGRQMIFGDGDGVIFTRLTRSIEVIAHELMHGVIQFAAALGYTGQAGALHEHLADAFAMMVKQYMLGQRSRASRWLFGEGLFGPAVNAKALRSLAAPGTAYDDPLLGRDPQPAHMRDYVETTHDNGGVHINSGILNRGFCSAAIRLGGYSWQVLGRIYYIVLTECLQADWGFHEFARATLDVAGELYGFLGREQRALAAAWQEVGLDVAVFSRPPARVPSNAGNLHSPFSDVTKQRQRLAA
jgi:Zn-dependent metalloprotease